MLLALPWLIASEAGAAEPPADLILHHTLVWTADDARPRAQAVAVRDGKIVRVGSNQEVLPLRGPDTDVRNLSGRMVVPGFIDAHTHFENATDWFFEVRLVDVTDEATMLARLRQVIARVPEQEWITGVEWGGHAAQERFTAGQPAVVAFQPTLAAIDALTPRQPVLFQRHDGAVFANSEALRRLRYTTNSPNPFGGEIGRDSGTGALNGMLYGTAAANAVRSMPPKSRRRTLVAARALLKDLNAYGITGIHDVARVDAISQATPFRTFVERSHSDVSIFEDLRAGGDLSVRVYAILTLATYDQLAAHGIRPGSGDEFIRYGALKAFIDGTLMFAPWASNPRYSGDFTMRVVNEQSMLDAVVGADKLGFDIATHAYGDKAHWLMLNWYEKAIAVNGPRDRRMRLVHAVYPAPAEIARAGKMGAVADITPYFAAGAEKRSLRLLGPERIGNAYPWRRLLDNGVRLNIVSDLPGSYDRSDELPIDPLVNIYYAVTRRPLGAPPSEGWSLDQALTVEEALRAYTINPAWSSHEESVKGSVSPGKWADLAVLSRDILKIAPEELPNTRVLATILGGRIIYEAR